jgi:hypothetical protein
MTHADLWAVGLVILMAILIYGLLYLFANWFPNDKR